MTISTWPAVLKARSWDAQLRNLSASGGTSPTGRTQRVMGDAGLWEVRVSGIVVRDRATSAAYRALTARLRTGEDILLPVRDLYLPVGGRHADALVVLDEAANLRATTLKLTVQAVDLVEGHYLTIGDRLHQVIEIVSAPARAPLLNPFAGARPVLGQPWSDEVAARASYEVKVLPPLRGPVGAGTSARVSDLTLRCVLKDPSDGDAPLDLGRFGTGDLTFIESL